MFFLLLLSRLLPRPRTSRQSALAAHSSATVARVADLANLITPSTVACVRASLCRRALDAPVAARWRAAILAIFDATKTVLAIGTVFVRARGDCRVGHVLSLARFARLLNGLDLGAGRCLVDAGQICEARMTNLPVAIRRVQFDNERLTVGAVFAKLD